MGSIRSEMFYEKNCNSRHIYFKKRRLKTTRTQIPASSFKNLFKLSMLFMLLLTIRSLQLQGDFGVFSNISLQQIISPLNCNNDMSHSFVDEQFELVFTAL